MKKKVDPPLQSNLQMTADLATTSIQPHETPNQNDQLSLS